MTHHQSPQESSAARKSSLAAGQYRPGWDVPSIVVMESAADVAAGLAMELASRHTRCLNSGEERVEYRLHCLSAASVSDVLEILHRDQVIAVILDLNSRAREALVLLQRLPSVGAAPPVIAIGTSDHHLLTGVLLEAGCTALLTALPYDTTLADWVSRVMEMREQAAEDRARKIGTTIH